MSWKDIIKRKKIYDNQRGKRMDDIESRIKIEHAESRIRAREYIVETVILPLTNKSDEYSINLTDNQINTIIDNIISIHGKESLKSLSNLIQSPSVSNAPSNRPGRSPYGTSSKRDKMIEDIKAEILKIKRE